MELSGKCVCVTGGSGFIGSHLIEALAAAGCRVRVLNHYRGSGAGGNLDLLDAALRDRLEVIGGDIRDPFAMTQFVEGADVVFHLAALVGIPYSYEAPASYVHTNVLGTLHLLEAARRAGVSRFVHTSTSEVYGSAQFIPIHEGHPLVGQSPYSASKIAADQLAESYRRSYGLAVVTVRPFNTFGPRQSARAVIPAILAQLILERGPLRLGDRTPVRDFTYVQDIAAGFVRAAACDAAVGHTINLASGTGVTIAVLAEHCMELCQRSAEILCEAPRLRPPDSEVRELVGDARLARDLIGWTPRFSLMQGLERVVEFVRRHPQRFAPAEFQR